MKIAAALIVVTVTLLTQSDVRPQGPAPPSRDGMPTHLPAVVQTCVPCHGVHGEGKPSAAFPRIAGQSAQYLAKQLDSYADGSRRDPTMEPIAKGLPPDLRAAVSTYYAQVEAPAAAGANPFTAAWAERGRVLATTGDRERGVQACANCHGPGGIGQPPAVPYLAGLSDRYIHGALNAWRDGRRRNDGGQQMAIVAKALSPDDVSAVARYYAGAPPPKPTPQNLVEPGQPQLLLPSMTRSITVNSETEGVSGADVTAPLKGEDSGSRKRR